jgi:cbb3-type cytochrome oxidase cytochrome c subunit
MKYGPLVFLAAFFAIAASWCSFVLAPQVQLGGAQQTTTVGMGDRYPISRPGQARQGLEVYRANGCAYCHSQQVGQTGVECHLILKDIGTNPVATAEVLMNARIGVSKISPPALAAGLPKQIGSRDLSMEIATRAAKALKAVSAKATVEVVPLGPDIARGWGNRRTVSLDFLLDDTVMPGSLRVGPDLANIGMRRADPNWQLRHLYNPRSEVEGSPMPAYRFLFEERKLGPGQAPSRDALQFEAGNKSAPPAGVEIVPKPEARALVAYLLSLNANAHLFETPMAGGAAPVETNSPSTNGPAAK